MEENEIRTEEFNENEEAKVLNDQESSGSGIVAAVIVGAVVLVGAGIAALIHKNKDKIDERRIKKLEKKGYTIQRPIEVDSDSNVFYAEVEETDE